MPEYMIQILERALKRERAARKQAEQLLEDKSRELHATGMQLRKSNERLQSLLDAKTNELEGIFLHILDPYVVMDPEFNVLWMNDAAKEFLEFDYERDTVNLSELVHPEFAEYTTRAVKQLYEMGSLKNYHAKIYTAKGQVKFVQINASVIFDETTEMVGAQGIIRDITREKEIEQLLEEQRHQLDSIFQNSPLGIFHFKNGQLLKGNPALAWMLGYAEPELPGLELGQFTQPLQTAEGISKFPFHEPGMLGSYTSTSPYTRKDGKEFWAKTTISSPVKDHLGQESLVAIVEDITQQRLAEEKIIASENRLASLVANLNIGVLLETEERNIALVNQHFCDIFKIPAAPKDLVGMDCTNAAEHSKALFADEVGFIAGIDQIFEEKKLKQEDELLMKDGRILERHYIRIHSGGAYQGYLWTYTDVTLRKNYEQSIEQQWQKYSSIIANMNLGLLEVDTEDTIQLANQSFCAMSGYSEAELVGQKAAQILRAEQPELIHHKNELRKARISDSYEVSLKNKAGQTRHWLLSGAPRFDEAGQFVGTIGIHLDITELKELEAQKEKLVRELQTSNQELQEYAHIVSHDLKSPLRSISALVTWLNEDHYAQLGTDGQKNLDLIQEKILAMENLINGILRYSRIQNDTADCQEVDLGQVVDEICNIIYIPPQVQVIREPLPRLCANPAQMHQLFQNLITNAVNHLPEKDGLVRVGSRDLGPYWECYVSDNGIGIAPEYHQKIFKIFQSIDTSRKGTGIGLSIVKKIIEIYSGTIRVESQAGCGATFYFTLPKSKNGKA